MKSKVGRGRSSERSFTVDRAGTYGKLELGKGGTDKDQERQSAAVPRSISGKKVSVSMKCKAL